MCVLERNETMNIQIVTEVANLDEIRKRLLSVKIVGIDFETTGLDPLVNRIRLVQIACRDGAGLSQVFVIDSFVLGRPCGPLYQNCSKIKVSPKSFIKPSLSLAFSVSLWVVGLMFVVFLIP